MFVCECVFRGTIWVVSTFIMPSLALLPLHGLCGCHNNPCLPPLLKTPPLTPLWEHLTPLIPRRGHTQCTDWQPIALDLSRMQMTFGIASETRLTVTFQNVICLFIISSLPQHGYKWRWKMINCIQPAHKVLWYCQRSFTVPFTYVSCIKCVYLNSRAYFCNLNINVYPITDTPPHSPWL